MDFRLDTELPPDELRNLLVRLFVGLAGAEEGLQWHQLRSGDLLANFCRANLGKDSTDGWGKELRPLLLGLLKQMRTKLDCLGLSAPPCDFNALEDDVLLELGLENLCFYAFFALDFIEIPTMSSGGLRNARFWRDFVWFASTIVMKAFHHFRGSLDMLQTANPSVPEPSASTANLCWSTGRLLIWENTLAQNQTLQTEVIRLNQALNSINADKDAISGLLKQKEDERYDVFLANERYQIELGSLSRKLEYVHKTVADLRTEVEAHRELNDLYQTRLAELKDLREDAALQRKVSNAKLRRIKAFFTLVEQIEQLQGREVARFLNWAMQSSLGVSGVSCNTQKEAQHILQEAMSPKNGPKTPTRPLFELANWSHLPNGDSGGLNSARSFSGDKAVRFCSADVRKDLLASEGFASRIPSDLVVQLLSEIRTLTGICWDLNSVA